MHASSVPATVVIPTIGRPDRLNLCLESISNGITRPSEVIVVDQSRDGSAEHLDTGELNVRVVRSRGVGRGLARNEGLESASNEVILFTDDDCSVDERWIGLAHDRLRAFGCRMILTGRVLPPNNNTTAAVPSTIDSEVPHDYTGELNPGVLCTGNMVCYRSELRQIGGFDTRIIPAAEDCDLCYRWVEAGYHLRYEPELVVWHNDSRTNSELRALYVDYAIGRGMFYAKYFRSRDFKLSRLLVRDVAWAVLAALSGLASGWDRNDPRLGIWRGLPAGLKQGWRTF